MTISAFQFTIETGLSATIELLEVHLLFSAYFECSQNPKEKKNPWKPKIYTACVLSSCMRGVRMFSL